QPHGSPGTAHSSTAPPRRGLADTPDAPGAAATGPACAAAGPRWPPTTTPRTPGRSGCESSLGSTTRTRTPAGADPARQSACTTYATPHRTTSADDPEPAFWPRLLCRPRGTRPATYTPSSGSSPTTPTHPRDARRPQPAQSRENAAPQACRGRVSC